jgi:hypothetical protein
MQISTASDFSTLPVTQSGITGTSYGAAVLSYNTQYYWRVRATNVGGSGPFSPAFMFTTIVAPPGAPTLISPANNASGVGTTPTLVWSVSVGATRYRLQLSTSSTFNSTILDDTTLTTLSRQVGPLSNNTTYYWRVSATNDGGTSSFSTAFSFTTILAAPSAPSLSSPANSATGVSVSPTLTWIASADAVSYTVQVSTSSGFSPIVATQSGITGTSYGVAGLSNNTQYYWRVSATNAGGTSSYSAAFSFTTIVTAPAAPTLASPSNGSVNVQINPTLSWNSSSGATSYSLQVSTGSGFASFVVNQSGITGASFNVVGLSNNTQYYWRVSAANAGGSSAFSAPFSFTTVAAVSGPPTLASPANNATDVSTSPTLSWNASSGATSYTVQLSTSAGFSSFVLNQSGVTSTVINVPGLANSTQYFWRVNATSPGGPTAFSSVFSFTTAAPAPAPPTLVSPANGITGIATNPTLSWSASGGAVTYNLHVSTSSNFSSFVVIQSGVTGTSFALSGLSLNTLYYWRVNASNVAGSSNWSSVWSFTTAPPPPSAPTPVLPANGATGVPTSPTLTWNAPSGAASYNLQVSTASDFSSVVVNLSGMTSTSHTPSGLNVNTQYYWRVNAANTWGTSVYSSTFSFRTLLPVPSSPALSSPATGAINLPRTVSFSWAAPPNAVSYHLQVSKISSFTPNVLDTTNITSLGASVTLDLNTTYYWRVSAINPSGEGAFSSARSFTIVRTTAVERLDGGLATDFALSQNYPNPFNPTTTIRFSIPSSSNVRITIYNALGNLVHLLVNGHYAPGQYTATWDASSLPSGVYFYRLQTDTFVDTKRLVLLK